MSALEFTGPIDNRRKKGDLVNIALALGLVSTGTIKDLIPRIKTYVKDHQAELASDPRFQKLVKYRPSAAGSGGAKSKETGKTSADKVTEDIHEARKAIIAKTGYV
jgi:hypothetical protein